MVAASTTTTSVTSSNNSAICSTTASQAWAILKRHARDEIGTLRLQELCRDNDRVSSLVSVHNSKSRIGGSSGSNGSDNNNSDEQQQQQRMLMVDLSRQRMTLETLNHLLRLATARNVKHHIRQLAWGPNDPDYPMVPQQQQRIAHRSRNIMGTTSTRKGSNTTVNNSRRNGGPSDNKDGPDEVLAGRHVHRRQQQQQDERQVKTILLQQQQQQHETKKSTFCFPSYHMSLRAPAGRGMEMLAEDGSNVLVEVHRDWDRMKRISDSLRRGQLPGVTGGMIKDVVVVGRGVHVMALRFVYLALCKDEDATRGRRYGIDGRGGSGPQRRIKFLTSVDPVRAAAVVADSDPSSTIVISIALTGEEETTMATQTLKTWLLTNLGNGRRSETILSKHTMLITGNEEVATKSKAGSVFLIPSHSRCEAFSTFTAATLLPLSIVFGWPIVEEFLAGAHDMDSHFVETNPRHNLPVLLALTDVWNDCLYSINSNTGRVLTPFTEAFAAYPAFVAALESQTCGRKKMMVPSATTSSPTSQQRHNFLYDSNATSTSSLNCSSLVIDGGLHGVYDRSLYQAGNVVPSELVMMLDSQLAVNADPKGPSAQSASHQQERRPEMDAVYDAQDALICSLFAHADGLAFGGSSSFGDMVDSPFGRPTAFGGATTTTGGGVGIGRAMSFVGDDVDVSNGNRPCSVVLCDKLDAYMCGQLTAMAEHRAVVKAWIWDIDPFAREGGDALRAKRTESLKETLREMMVGGPEEDNEDEDDDRAVGSSELSLSTRTILQHYAKMVRGRR